MNDSILNKQKEILTKMNLSETNFETFYEIIEKETGGTLTFSSFKTYLDKYYESINKMDRIFLLKQISIDYTGKLNLTEVFNNFSKLMNQPIASPILCFYNVASIIEKNLKISTLEFIYKNGLSLEDEININDFFIKISENLKIDDITTILVFKSLDSEKKGKIRVEDFLVVIDSYREDISEELGAIKQTKSSYNEFTQLINDINYLKNQLENESISISEIYEKTNLDEFGKLFEVYNNIKLLIKNINTEIVENVLNFLKKEKDNKIYKKDLENILTNESIDERYIINYLKNKVSDLREVDKYKLNDTQIFWINKLCSLLDTISITPLMAFEATLNDKQNKIINIDNFKRKLQKMIPVSRVTAVELNNIAESIDINKNKNLSYEEFNEIIEIGKTDPKFSVMVRSSGNFFGGTNTLINSFVKTKRTANELPIKGNTKALSMLKTNLSKTINTTNKNKNNSNIKDDMRQPKEKVDNNYISSISKTDTEMNDIKDKKEKIDNLKVEFNPVKEFIKEIEVFENGEWSFIEILEDINLHEIGLFPAFELNKLLIKKYHPTISKNKIFSIIKTMDNNNDGYISNKDIISFLLNFLKHRSTKLALKEVARKIEHEEKLSTEDYFSRKFLQSNNEINFITFVQFFINNFELEPPIVKKIYEELKKILNNKSKILVSDIIDLVNEYREDSQRIKERKINKEYNSISLLDKKYYEQEMKNLVRILNKGIGLGNSLRSNLENYLNLPSNFKFSQFRELFIKPLSMDFSLGVATFQLLKSFNTKDTATISKEDLLNLLDSYIDSSYNEMDPEVIVYYIENNFTPLNFCIESIPYNYKGISIMDLIRTLELFYPKINRNTILNLCKFIDERKLGMVTYKTLSNFIYKNSKKQQYSNDLMIKYLASIVDYKNIITNEFIVINAKIKKESNMVQYAEHIELFSNYLQFHLDQADNLFLHLANNCPYPGAYNLKRLEKMVNSIRQVRRDIKRTVIYDNSSQVEQIKSQSLEFTEFLRSLNDNVNLSESFNQLSIGEHLHISIYDIYHSICKIYKNVLDLDKQMLLKLLKFYDVNKKGSVPYEVLIKNLKNTLEEFEVSIVLHLKYLANKLNKEYSGKLKDYLTYKGISSPNNYVTYELFETLFKEECLNSDFIIYNMFEYLKEKKGSKVNLVFIQNLIDCLSSMAYNFSPVINNKNLSEEESEDILKSTIYRIEKEDSIAFSSLFDYINLNNVNQFGKINSDSIKMILKDYFNLDVTTISVFCNYFTKLLNLFDLMKLIDLIENTSTKSKVNSSKLLEKIKLKIPNDRSVVMFAKTLNVNFHKPLTLVDTCLLFKPIFDLSTYECFFIFKEIVQNESNVLIDENKISIDFFLQHYNLYKYFSVPVEKANKRIDQSLLNSLRKFFTYLESVTNKLEIFKKYDTDKSGVLNRNEFFQMLKSCKEAKLNDSQMIKILNFADKNNDDSINYLEFIEFVNTMSNELGDLSKENEPEIVIRQQTQNDVSAKYTETNESEVINKKKTEPIITTIPALSDKIHVTKIDYKKLTETYQFNLKNMKEAEETPFNVILYHIQEYLLAASVKKDNLEILCMKCDVNNKDVIPIEEFFDYFHEIVEKVNLNIEIDDEIEEKLWDYSMEGFVKKVKNNLMIEKLFHYRNFFNNLTKFRVKVVNKSLGKSTKSEAKNSKSFVNQDQKENIIQKKEVELAGSFHQP